MLLRRTDWLRLRSGTSQLHRRKRLAKIAGTSGGTARLCSSGISQFHDIKLLGNNALICAALLSTTSARPRAILAGVALRQLVSAPAAFGAFELSRVRTLTRTVSGMR